MSAVRGAWIGAVGIIFLLPGVAYGATARTSSHSFFPRVTYLADTGEPNQLAVSTSANQRRIVFTDPGAAAIEPGRGCRFTRSGTGAVSCEVPRGPRIVFELPGGFEQQPGFVVVRAKLGDGDDDFESTGLVRELATKSAPTQVYSSVLAGEGADSLTLGAVEDVISPGHGDDFVEAGPGGDLIESGARSDGADMLDGGAGFDSIGYFLRRTPVTATPNGEADDGADGEGDNLLGYEGVFGGRDDDHLVDGDGPGFLLGLGGDDELIGARGDDLLFGDLGGSRGEDVLRAGPGRDHLIGDGGRDVLLAGAGRDAVLAGGDFIPRRRGEERDRVDCGAGRDRVRAQFKDRLHACERVRRVRPRTIRDLIEDSVVAAPPRSPAARALLDRRLDRGAHPLGK